MSISAIGVASVANVFVGFDILGFSVAEIYDTITISRIDDGVTIQSDLTDLPLDPEKNTAGKVVKTLLSNYSIEGGLAIDIKKGIPLSSGLGGSAASAAGAAVW